jgi:hypothetical protein
MLEHHADERLGLKRALKAGIDQKDAKLATSVKLRNDQGDEIKDERQFQKGALARELDGVKDAMAPIIELEARRVGMVMNEKQVAEGMAEVDFGDIGKEIIRKTAA